MTEVVGWLLEIYVVLSVLSAVTRFLLIRV